MPLEIERKFLVIDDTWRDSISSKIKITQGYLANTERGSIRVRISGDKAKLNIKSMTLGITRTEYDYPIPVADAREMVDKLCLQPIIEKTRYFIKQNRHVWEIDVFSGENSGLIVAEIELADSEEAFYKPAWLGEEVSDDPRYYNVCLVEKPYNSW